MGDFNSQIGGKEAEEEEKIVNTWFKKKHNKRWTWISPNMETKSQIDYIQMDRNTRNINDCGILKNFKCDIDHRILTIELVHSLTPKKKYKNIPHRNEKLKKI